MWRAECRVCTFTVVRMRREEAETGLIAHVQDSGHVKWSLFSVVSNDSVQSPRLLFATVPKPRA